MVVLKPIGGDGVAAAAADVAVAADVAEPSEEVSRTFSAKWQLLHSGFPSTTRIASAEPS